MRTASRPKRSRYRRSILTTQEQALACVLKAKPSPHLWITSWVGSLCEVWERERERLRGNGSVSKTLPLRSLVLFISPRCEGSVQGLNLRYSPTLIAGQETAWHVYTLVPHLLYLLGPVITIRQGSPETPSSWCGECVRLWYECLCLRSDMKSFRGSCRNSFSCFCLFCCWPAVVQSFKALLAARPILPRSSDTTELEQFIKQDQVCLYLLVVCALTHSIIIFFC